MKKIGNKESLMQSLAELVVKEIQSHELTIDEFAMKFDISRNAAFRLLQEQTKIGKLKSRQATKNGKRVTAYSEA